MPQPGWAEHRPREDWWDDLCFISRKLLAESGLDLIVATDLTDAAKKVVAAAARK